MEARMMARMDAAEARMIARMGAAEARMVARMDAADTRGNLMFGVTMTLIAIDTMKKK
eukprot:CAMPEP_0170129680 /NCGR_PEP_ID=MMETSP0020_2-20130122/22043_1 /TAXON_ID=98059 /ORGANISM="Dinobryon sp., Strain UTEXLB2267" /LENGTH=57 /DNA_ID=CAMNT_0010364103 /DNA_START=488 /DNA_END=661 /DNA_ORIENTATION=-